MSRSPTHILPFTGERFAPEVTGAIWYEHWHRYCAVQSFAKGLTVLDAACGEGYGTFLLAATAKEVVGIDLAPDAIAHAKSRYIAPNLRYEQGSVTALPLPDASIDLVVSFETIEHLWEQAAMLAEFRRVLAPGGALVISSPNLPVYSEFGAHINDYHVRELTRDELAALLDPVFPQQRWYAQRVVAHSALWAEGTDRAATRKSQFLVLGDNGPALEAAPGPSMYFVVVCGAADAGLPVLPALSLFDDGKQSLYADYNRALLREKQLSWEALDARKIGEDRLVQLIAATNDLASERQRAAALTDRVAVTEEAYRKHSDTSAERVKSLEAAHDALQGELGVEREYSASLAWEERNARNVAEGRLAELITAVNNLASEREKAETLGARVAALDAALNAERDRNAALVWDERNWRNVGEERLKELILSVNALSSEKAKSVALETTLGATQASLSEARASLAQANGEVMRWNAALAESQARLAVTEDALADFDRYRARLAETETALGETRSALAAEQATLQQAHRDLADFAEVRAALADSQGRLAQANTDIMGRNMALMESQSRLAYRETIMGWLRFPMAWLRMRLRGKS